MALVVLGALVWAWAILPGAGAQAAPIAPGLSAHVAPTDMVPGQAGYASVSGGYPLDVTMTLDGQPLDVFWTGSSYEALFSFGLDEKPGSHTLAISASDSTTGAAISDTTTITVGSFSYRDEQVSIPYSLRNLLDPKLNQSEAEKLAAIYKARSRPVSFDWPFVIPVPGGIVTSRYGGNRVFNGGVLATRHTGIDFRRFIGEPVTATADGRVAAAEHFDIHGNVVILDHGYGVFSMYAHLSQILVQPGDLVRQGQIIGLAGATGRTNGPHLHFEIIVYGNEVDPLKWLALAPGFVPPREATPRPSEQPPGG